MMTLIMAAWLSVFGADDSCGQIVIVMLKDKSMIFDSAVYQIDHARGIAAGANVLARKARDHRKFRYLVVPVECPCTTNRI